MKIIIVLTTLFVAVTSIHVSATIINIPDDYPTIQEGINASNDGDTVLVQPGTYVENINFNGHNIVLGSLFLTTGDTSYISSTIIDGDSSGSVVTFESGEDSTTVITGFTIQNGCDQHGGGIFLYNNSNPKILYNIITGNKAEGWGGGIYCNTSNPIISNNMIIDNVTINILPIAGNGGGIWCYNSNVCISTNIIMRNSAESYGGGIFCAYSIIVINNNVITENSVSVYRWSKGGGIYCSLSNGTITNNSVCNNMANYQGGGMCLNFSSPFIVNNIFWADTASEDNNEIYVYSGSPIIIYCDIQGGWEGEGNIDCDPWFCYPDTGNFYLAENSCCVGAGCDSLGNPDSTVNIGALGIGCGEHTYISEEQYVLPIKFSLFQNYPNPFNVNTIIPFSLPEQGLTTLKIYDLLGKEVQILVNEFKQSGNHVFNFNASELSSGIYFYRLKAGNFTQTKKMLLVK